MPWWSWILIWSGLVILLLVVLVLLGLRLFRRLMAIFDELQRVTSKLEILENAGEIVDTQLRELAILASYNDVQRAYNLTTLRRAERKAERHRTRVERGKIITTMDSTQRTWPDVR